MSLALQEPTDTYSIVPQAMELAQRLAPTEFVPRALRNRPEAVLGAMLTGREVGLPPMQSLSMINVIDGRPSLNAQAVRTLILARGHQLWVEDLTTTRCVLCGRRRGEDRVHKVTWTTDDAVRAGLAGKQNWRQYPRQMVLARATGELGRLAFADVMGGMAYVTEEVQDGGFEEPRNGQVDPPGPTVGEEREMRKTSRRRRRTEPEPSGAEGSHGAQGEPATLTSTSHETASPAPEPPMPDPPQVEDEARDVQVTQNLSLAQQLAMVCREAGIERAQLIQALTGKTSARDVTREEALRILSAAREIASGRQRLVEENGLWTVLEVADQTDLWQQEDEQ